MSLSLSRMAGRKGIIDLIFDPGSTQGVLRWMDHVKIFSQKMFKGQALNAMLFHSIEISALLI